jgi:signal transduction histidine kinase
MFRSIRWRLIASYVLLTVLTASAVGVLSIEIMRRYVQRQEAEDLRANAQAVAQQALPLMWPRVRDRELGQLARTAAFLGSARVRILDRHAQVLADSGAPGEANKLVWIAPSLRSQLSQGERIEWPGFMMLPGGGSVLLTQTDLSRLDDLPPGLTLTFVRRTYTPWGGRIEFETYTTPEEAAPAEAQPRSTTRIRAAIGDEDAPLGMVEFSAGPNYAEQALMTTQRALAFAGGGAILLAALVGVWISQRLAGPIRTLTESAGRMAGGDLSSRVQIQSKDEIGELAEQFNRMAAQLQASFHEVAAERDALRRFIADAAHELRTPITALKNFNALLRGEASGDPQAREEFLQESQAQIERMQWISDNLLNLSRLEAGLIDLDRHHHDTGDLLAAAASALKPVSREKGIDLEVNSPDPAPQLYCDRRWTELALSNLIDNAIKFTPPGGKVELGARGGEDVIRLWVQDNGIGIQPEDRDHIFERFYRGKTSTAPGSGLGLAMVKSVMEAQGGRVSVDSIPGKGSRFILEWALG